MSSIHHFFNFFLTPNFKIMNTAQAREIPIEKILQNLGCEPTKTNGNESWYLSPFRLEKTASFKINIKINRWFDHGEQKGGNVIDFVVLKFGFNVSEALEYLNKFETFFSFHKQIFQKPKVEVINHITKIIPVQHLALVQYLKSRGISIYQNSNNLKEIHYSINDKNYFGLGFENNSGGFEIRSKYAKICLGSKDVSHIKNEKETIRIFEGFFDFLSFIQKENLSQRSDYLILNSVALIMKNISILNHYKHIELYLDNDSTGDKYTAIIKENFRNSVDLRFIFKDFKDFNEWFSTCELEVL